MRKLQYTRLAIRSFTLFSCVLVTIWALTLPVKTEAEVPPPTKTPLPTATDAGEPSDTPAPSDTPVPSDTPIPSDTPMPAPSDTPTVAPTHTSAPSDTPIWTPSPTLRPTFTSTPANTPKPTDPPAPQPGPEQTSRPEPACLSMVEGTVTSHGGQGVAGATVIIQGPGWSSGIMTDDKGRFGFGGLCAGSATLQGTLPDRQLTAATTVSLDGKSSVNVELSTQTGGAAAPTQAATTATDLAAQPNPTSAPGMPTTGFSGVLLGGGAILGILLVVFAGARRSFGARD